MMPNEIKKLVYKQQPKALFEKLRGGVAYYVFSVVVSDSTSYFHAEIPVKDMGSTDFLCEMEAKFLLRWLIINPQE